MKAITLAFAAFVILLVFSGCEPHDVNRGSVGETPAASTPLETKSYSSQELAQVIVPGMTKEKILNLFGTPLNTNELAEGGVSLNYSFPADYRPGSKVSQIAGVSIYVKDERVFGWAPWYQSFAGFPAGGPSTPVPVQRSSNAKVVSKNHLSFWSVSKGPVEGGRLIDTKQLPVLGYIPAQPTLVVNRLKTLLEDRQMGFDKNGGQVEFPAVELQFFDEDAAAFERLSTQFRGKQVLMMLGETPVIAPYMISVITNGRVTVLWKQDGFNEIRDRLADLLPPK